MKKSLLATVAAAALIAGPAFAQKQEAPAGDAKGAAPPPAAIQKAPAEKMAPAGKVAPDKAASDSKAPAKSTTGQAAPSGKASGEIKAGSDTKAGKSSADTKSGADSKAATGADTKSGIKASGTTDTKASGTATQGQAAAGANVSLTPEQRSTIRSSVLTANAPRVSDVNFSISVGTVVPRSVRLVAVPAPLIAIHPAWRGFLYFVHRDRIIIVEPGTLRIVTVLVV